MFIPYRRLMNRSTTWLSALDLKSAYYQISINSEDKIYTAFEVNGKLYQYRRLPFGVTNAVYDFQRIIDRLITKQSEMNLHEYVFGQHNNRRNQYTGSWHKLWDIPSGCGWCLLDFQQGKICHSSPPNWHTRLSRLARNYQARSWKPMLFAWIPIAIFVEGVKTFAYYVWWIRNFSAKLKPLTAKQLSFPLQNDIVKAFEDLHSGLLHASLACINDYEPFTIEHNVSDFAIAGILNQGGRPVAFILRSLAWT